MAPLFVVLLVLPARAPAQSSASPARSPHYWSKLTLGALTSILLHEAAHIGTSYAVGGHPSFGFDNLRPTVFSGIDSRTEPRRQFLFSIAGLATQSVIDEAILDVPHHRGSAFERGLLAGGIGTTIFYLTIGRRGTVSDVDFMARTHVMTKTQVTLLFGTIAAAHTIRISRDRRYANFFARPRGDGGADFGLAVRTR